MISDEVLIEKLNQLSTHSKQQFISIFISAHNDYFDNKLTVSIERSPSGQRTGWNGIGVWTYWWRHAAAERIMRGEIDAHKLKEVLHDFLHENTGMNKSSLKFYVLTAFFDLDRNDYNNDQAKSLIITTRSLLFHIIENTKENIASSPKINTR